MTREAKKEDLNALLQLYLYLHEQEIPEDSQALRETWDVIMKDENHHIILNVADGVLVSSCVCVVIPNLTGESGHMRLLKTWLPMKNTGGKDMRRNV